VAATHAEEHAFEPTFADTIHAPVLPPVDPVLLEILRSEVAQYLQTIRNAVDFADGDLPIDDGLLRAVHTLHGAIAMVDIPLLIHLLSPLESLLKRLRAAGQPLSTEGVRLLRQSADVVDQVMAQFDVRIRSCRTHRRSSRAWKNCAITSPNRKSLTWCSNVKTWPPLHIEHSAQPEAEEIAESASLSRRAKNSTTPVSEHAEPVDDFTAELLRFPRERRNTRRRTRRARSRAERRRRGIRRTACQPRSARTRSS
jgi:chemotaxis protein histidine kinase CheA